MPLDIAVTCIRLYMTSASDFADFATYTYINHLLSQPHHHIYILFFALQTYLHQDACSAHTHARFLNQQGLVGHFGSKSRNKPQLMMHKYIAALD